ncbi:hypothetical protein BUUB107078_25760 [Burkholderia ubonensis]
MAPSAGRFAAQDRRIRRQRSHRRPAAVGQAAGHRQYGGGARGDAHPAEGAAAYREADRHDQSDPAAEPAYRSLQVSGRRAGQPRVSARRPFAAVGFHAGAGEGAVQVVVPRARGDGGRHHHQCDRADRARHHREGAERGPAPADGPAGQLRRRTALQAGLLERAVARDRRRGVPARRRRRRLQHDPDQLERGRRDSVVPVGLRCRCVVHGLQEGFPGGAEVGRGALHASRWGRAVRGDGSRPRMGRRRVRVPRAGQADPRPPGDSGDAAAGDRPARAKQRDARGNQRIDVERHAAPAVQAVHDVCESVVARVGLYADDGDRRVGVRARGAGQVGDGFAGAAGVLLAEIGWNGRDRRAVDAAR